MDFGDGLLPHRASTQWTSRFGNECGGYLNGKAVTHQICCCKVLSLCPQSEGALFQLHFAVLFVVIAILWPKL